MFIEREFPRAFSLGAVGGPGYLTDVKAGDSGFEQRNQRWEMSLASWTVSFNAKPQAWFDLLQDFFHAARGKFNSFRMFWHADYLATDEFIGTGDEVTTVFPLQKTYAADFDGAVYVKRINKPITAAVLDYAGEALTDTVVIKVNGVVEPGVTISHTTGQVTFAVAPHGAAYNTTNDLNGGVADIITWSGQFHWPVRLDIDSLQPQMTTPKDGGIKFTVGNLLLKEVRIKPGDSE